MAEFFAVIPARGGSKGIPHKNTILCHGKPLLSYTCQAALNSKYLSRTILSTDDAKIAEVADAYGVDAPFIRPNHLSNDTAPMIGVLQHALDWFESSGYEVEAVVLLQPTSPFRTSRHVDEAIELFIKSSADSVVSVMEVPHQFNPVSVMKMEDGKLVPFLVGQNQILRRQDKPRVYARNGPAVLVVKPELVRAGTLYGDKCIGYLMDSKSSIDIDSYEDLRVAEVLLGEEVGNES